MLCALQMSLALVDEKPPRIESLIEQLQRHNEDVGVVRRGNAQRMGVTVSDPWGVERHKFTMRPNNWDTGLERMRVSGTNLPRVPAFLAYQEGTAALLKEYKQDRKNKAKNKGTYLRRPKKSGSNAWSGKKRPSTAAGNKSRQVTMTQTRSSARIAAAPVSVRCAKFKAAVARVVARLADRDWHILDASMIFRSGVWSPQARMMPYDEYDESDDENDDMLDDDQEQYSALNAVGKLGECGIHHVTMVVRRGGSCCSAHSHIVGRLRHPIADLSLRCLPRTHAQWPRHPVSLLLLTAGWPMRHHHCSRLMRAKADATPHPHSRTPPSACGTRVVRTVMPAKPRPRR